MLLRMHKLLHGIIIFEEYIGFYREWYALKSKQAVLGNDML